MQSLNNPIDNSGLDGESLEQPKTQHKTVRLPTLEEMRKIQQDILDKKQAYKFQQTEDSQMESMTPAQIAQIVLNAKREAAQIVENAKLEARALAEQIESDAYAVREQVFEQAREEAYQESQRIALDELAESTRLLDTVYAEAAARFKEQAQRMFDQLKEYMLDAALQIARKIMNTEFDRNDETYRNMLQAILSDLTTKHPIILRVSPWEYKRFFQDGNTLLETLQGGMLTIEVYEDKALARSEFKVVMEAETISGGINSQLERLGFALDYTKIE